MICVFFIGVPISIPNSGIPVLNSIPNSGIENWEIPVFQRQQIDIFGQIMDIFGKILAKFFCKNIIFEVGLTGNNSDK